MDSVTKGGINIKIDYAWLTTAYNPNSKACYTGETPYTKCELRQQTNQNLELMTATEGCICKLILRFSHTAEYMTVQADIAYAD